MIVCMQNALGIVQGKGRHPGSKSLKEGREAQNF